MAHGQVIRQRSSAIKKILYIRFFGNVGLAVVGQRDAFVEEERVITGLML